MDLICEFEESNWSYFTKVYSCIVQPSNIFKTSVQIRAINGFHEDGKTNKNVEAIFFKNIIVKFIPRGLDFFFTNLTCLYIDSCGLKSICRKDLSQFPKLEGLWIEGNELTTLPDEETEIDFFC
jgi:Leucine-rich repeat (LRR) protein